MHERRREIQEERLPFAGMPVEKIQSGLRHPVHVVHAQDRGVEFLGVTGVDAAGLVETDALERLALGPLVGGE